MESYQVSQEHVDQLSNLTKSSIAFGPLTISWSLDLRVPQITVDATLVGIPIGSAVINPQHPSATIGGSVGPFTAEVELEVDFAKKELKYRVLVKAFGKKIVDKSGVLFSW